MMGASERVVGHEYALTIADQRPLFGSQCHLCTGRAGHLRQRLRMIAFRSICLFALCTSMLALSEEARAQYNLRTQPATPIAGQPFSVVFDEDECEDFIVQAPGQPPSFTLNGTEAVLAIDRIENPACDSAAVTVSIPVPPLPAGAYTLRLVGRDFVVPEITGTLQVVPLSVVQGVSARPFTVPVLSDWGLALLGGLSVMLAGRVLRRA